MGVICHKIRSHYMKLKANKLEEKSNNKNVREMYKAIKKFKEGYHPRAYVTMKDNCKFS